jgi:hypothetical protein
MHVFNRDIPVPTWRSMWAFSRVYIGDSMKSLAVILAIALNTGGIQAQPAFSVQVNIHNVGPDPIYTGSIFDATDPSYVTSPTLNDELGGFGNPVELAANSTSGYFYVSDADDGGPYDDVWFGYLVTAVTMTTGDGGGATLTDYFYATESPEYFDLYYYNSTTTMAAFAAISDNDNTAAFSFDGINWIASPQGLPYDGGMLGVCFGDGMFVAVGYGTDGAISLDGVNWSPVTLPSGVDCWNSVTYGDGVFVAVADYPGEAAVSSDGISWTEYTMPDGFCNSVAYGDGRFVAVGESGNIDYSLDGGESWSSYTPYYSGYPYGPEGGEWWGVAYGGEYFQIVGYNGDDQAIFGFPYDGWETTTLPDPYWWSVAYGGGTLAAVGSGPTAYISNGYDLTSSSGTVLTDDWWAGVAYGSGMFVAVGANAHNAAYSYDGETWTGSSTPSTTDNLTAVAASY